MVIHSLQAICEGLLETRRALQELRAKPLEDFGLAVAVGALAESYADRFDFRVDLNIDQDFSDFPVDVQQCVYRITQEALANVADHAQAHTAQGVLTRDRDQLRLIIRDDGCGFDPSSPGKVSSYGLLGMRERAEMIGGSLSVRSQLGKGTQISMSYGWPMTNQAAGRIRLLICDDQAIVCEGLRAMLEPVPDIEIVGVANSGVEAINLTRTTHPNLVLMDLKMDGMNGVQATKAIRAQFPDVRVLVLTTYDADGWVIDAIRGGAAG
jgi:CheY-like chemotaxis protein